jgi:hypothetical protein
MALTRGASILMDLPDPSGRPLEAAWLAGRVVGSSSFRRRSMAF